MAVTTGDVAQVLGTMLMWFSAIVGVATIVLSVVGRSVPVFIMGVIFALVAVLTWRALRSLNEDQPAD